MQTVADMRMKLLQVCVCVCVCVRRKCVARTRLEPLSCSRDVDRVHNSMQIDSQSVELALSRALKYRQSAARCTTNN